jgi:hypothetical protein
MSSVVFLYCYADFHYAKCYFVDSHCALCRYTECYYSECRYTECRVAFQNSLIFASKTGA